MHHGQSGIIFMLAELKHTHDSETPHQGTGAKRAGLEARCYDGHPITKGNPQSHGETDPQHNSVFTTFQIVEAAAHHAGINI